MRILCLLMLFLAQPLVAETSAESRGADVFNDREKGHCLLCHSYSRNPEPFQGNLGPSLDGVALRYDRDALKARIADSRVLNPETIMPPYFSKQGLQQVSSEYLGQTVLSAEELDDLVSYLLSEVDDNR